MSFTPIRFSNCRDAGAFHSLKLAFCASAIEALRLLMLFARTRSAVAIICMPWSSTAHSSLRLAQIDRFLLRPFSLTRAMINSAILRPMTHSPSRRYYGFRQTDLGLRLQQQVEQHVCVLLVHCLPSRQPWASPLPRTRRYRNRLAAKPVFIPKAICHLKAARSLRISQ